MNEWDNKEIKIFKISKTGEMTNNFRRTFLDSSGETRRLVLQKIDDKTISWDSKVIEFYRNGGKIYWWGEESKPKNTARNIDDLSDGSEVFFLDQNNNKVYKTHLLRKNLLTGEIGAKLSQILWGNSKWNLAYCFLDLEVFDYDIAKLKNDLDWKADMQVSITLSVKGTSYQKALHQKFFNNEIYRGWTSILPKLPVEMLKHNQVITAQPLFISSNYQVRVQVDGWIYLMHPEEYINQGLAVYKVGLTEAYYPDKRTKSYGEEGVPLGIWSVPLTQVRAIETELKNTFKTMIAPTKGTEYFSLPARLMLEIINGHITSLKDIGSYEERGNFTLISYSKSSESLKSSKSSKDEEGLLRKI